MIRIEFDDTLRTGDSRVDAQHEQLLGMFNELYEATRDGGRGHELIGPLLERLHDYTVEHFAAEQQLMVDAALPAYEMLSHFEEHGRLTRRVHELVNEYGQHGMATILPIATLLQEWLAEHIRVRDRRVVEHLRSQGMVAEAAGF